jgi:hypothetical protein
MQENNNIFRDYVPIFLNQRFANLKARTLFSVFLSRG